MITQAYSVYDIKAELFGTPFFAQNHHIAMRSFMDLCKDVNTLVCRHPEDFRLYCVGEFNDQTGQMVELSKPGLIAQASDFLKTGESK